MREKYIDLMEKVLTAYSDAHILRYFDDVKRDGLTEHGFPRLTADIGILIAHGKRGDLLPLFLEMMDFCCAQFSLVKAANDFSVREIVSCIYALEKSDAVDRRKITEWKNMLAKINPTDCYTVYAKNASDDVRNWALFSAVSEFARQSLGICESTAFIDLQIASQLKFIDENGMYMDNEKELHHQPMMYDIVSRVLFSLLLHFGYRGQYYETISAFLKKAALLMLDFQSTTGEAPFGGRSVQFMHNEGFLAAICEFEANRYIKEGNKPLALRFKAAAARAYASCEYWLSKEPIYHIKNRFPTKTEYGCEFYAYFDKYMITTASNFYTAYIMCNEDIPVCDTPDIVPSVCKTSEFFHKFQLKSGGYTLEFDTNGDPEYDASGLGRVQYKDAPPQICLSVPCPKNPLYKLSLPDRTALSLCPGIRKNGEWFFALDADTQYEVTAISKDDSNAYATVLCHFSTGDTVTTRYTVNAESVKISICGKGEIAYMLPAFHFDGEIHPECIEDTQSLRIQYEGWCCQYQTNGRIFDLKQMAENRNGHYRAYAAQAENEMEIQINIERF